MPEDFSQKVSNMWNRFRKQAADTVASTETGFVRGKIAGKAVIDDAGVLIVDAGHPIDDAVIARAAAAGKMHALVTSAVTAKAQDFKDHAHDAYAATPEGVEAHSMATSEAYLDARRYIGHIAGTDVNDSKGNVIVPMGMKIDDDDVRAARDANQLEALIYAAQQPLPQGFVRPADRIRATTEATAPVYVSRRHAVPLGEAYEQHDREPAEADPASRK